MSRVDRSTESSPFKMVDISKIPGKTSRRREEWLRVLRSIPPGKAIVTTEKELGSSASSVTLIVNRYIKEGLIPDTYRVTRRTKGDITTVYILNDSKAKEEA